MIGIFLTIPSLTLLCFEKTYFYYFHQLWIHGFVQFCYGLSMSYMKYFKSDFNGFQMLFPPRNIIYHPNCVESQSVLKLKLNPNQISNKFRFNSVEVEVVRIIVRFWFSAFFKIFSSSVLLSRRTSDFDRV